MAADKHPMQADGGDGHGNPQPGSRGGGESGGGPYPNPRSGKEPEDGPLGHGGQTEVEQKQPGKTLGETGKA